MASSDQYLIGEVPFITWASYAKAQVKVTLRSSFIFLKGPSGVSGLALIIRVRESKRLRSPLRRE